MNQQQKQSAARTRRIARVRARILGRTDRPRLAVRRSLKHISAQIIDDATRRTLVAAADRELPKSAKRTKTETALDVGKLLAERALAKSIKTVVFDRRDKKYHGRVKALADGARAGGLTF